MTKTRALQVRLTIAQHEQLKATASRRGFSSLSSFMRYVALEQDFGLVDKVTELHRAVLGDKKARGRVHPPSLEAVVEEPSSQ